MVEDALLALDGAEVPWLTLLNGAEIAWLRLLDSAEIAGLGLLNTAEVARLAAHDGAKIAGLRHSFGFVFWYKSKGICENSACCMLRIKLDMNERFWWKKNSK